MSKGGGAGKVYFVLYLAVVLELLIIIVERDEAEENLHRKQKETMQIVESILSQLQAGSGTEGINTKPQDQITMLEPGMNAKEEIGVDIKSDRQYLVEVGVTDISDELSRRESEGDNEFAQRVLKLVELGNVEELEYQIFYSSNQDPSNAPMFPSEQEIKKQKIDFTKYSPGQTVQGPNQEVWEFMGVKKLSLDKEKTFSKIQINKETKKIDLPETTPIYNLVTNIGSPMIPNGKSADSSFFYSIEKTDISHGLKKRTFTVNFEPVRKAGWFKLRFASRTNRILGVRATQKPEDLSPNSKVNIGTVQLTIGDLIKVKKELTAKLDKYGLPGDEILNKENDIDKFDARLKASQQMAFKEDNARDIVSKIQLYGYIAKLLAPGQSIHFPQNQGSIEFNIRVILPENRGANPEIVLPLVRTFDKLPAVFDFTISPFNGEGGNKVSGEVKNSEGRVVASIICTPQTVTAAGTPIPAPVRGAKREYLGTVDKSLPPGRYTMVVTHAIGGKTAPRETELTVFETSLTQESKDYIQRRFERAYFATYHLGNQSVVPSSGGTIRPEEFRIYISTDDQGSQVAPIEGLSIPQNRAPYLSSKSNKVSLKVTWKQPVTGKEVDVLPEMSADIKLKPPSVNLSSKTEEEAQTGTKWRKTIRNIYIQTPDLDQNTKAKVVLKADRPVLDGIEGGALNLEMSEPRETGNGAWEIELTGTVKMPAGKSVLNGQINIPLTAIATAKDKTSSAKVTLNTTVECKKDSRGGGNSGGRPSGGGGGTAKPAPAPTKAPTKAPSKPAPTKPSGKK